MLKRSIFLLVLLAISFIKVGGQDHDPAYRIVGYYPSYSIYGSQYFVTDIPADKLTHINYAFANISDTGEIVLGDEYADSQYAYPENAVNPAAAGGNLGQLARLKIQHPHLKTLISVGGYTWSGRFTDIALTEETRGRFARSCVEFIRRYGLDGVDIDWEFPTGTGVPGEISRPEDVTNFVLLMASLRTALDEAAAIDRRPYLLTVAMGGTRDTYEPIDLAALHPLVDWMNLMTYSMNGDYPKLTALSAPLYDVNGRASVDRVVQDFLAAGVPAEKLVIGVPFYAIGWQGAAAINNGLHQPYTGLANGSLGPGFYDYASIAADYVPFYPRIWDASAQVPLLYDAQNGVMISYDDVESIGLKATYVRQQKLGGAMIWELSGDDDQATLLSALANGLTTAVASP